MNMNIVVKVSGGKRTPVRVEAYSTAVNTKTIAFSNGKQITDAEIVEWIENQLSKTLKKFAEDETK